MNERHSAMMKSLLAAVYVLAAINEEVDAQPQQTVVGLGSYALSVTVVVQGSSPDAPITFSVDRQQLPTSITVTPQEIVLSTASRTPEEVTTHSLNVEVTLSEIVPPAGSIDVPFILRDSNDREWRGTIPLQLTEKQVRHSAVIHPVTPNPFNSSTVINYELFAGGRVQLRVYNSVGQLMRTLVEEKRAAGKYSVVWDGRTDTGASTATGIYYLHLVTDHLATTQRMALVK